MVRSRMAKAISNAAWGTLTGFVTYKAASAGGVTKPVKPHGSTIECAGCGEPVPKSLSDRVHSCPRCGRVEDRDVNAAQVIEARAEFRPGAGRQGRSEPVAA